ncbi:FAR-17a/AIG1-like protein [Irpex rosettiformis]|uniref:FAR-17a/AIG1-like protein n=1 Tax=Irpex rosettiformis TaxID=378272 RepID=A0ACB8UH00_9APHY|nr:FAR-17a/AIG1-like protein [Irpex rosettiformis]
MAGFRPGAVLLRTTAAGIMARAWFELDQLPNNAFVEKQVGGHFQFLTIQGLFAAWATMSLGLLADMVSSQALTKLKRALFMIAMPVIVISSIYWSLLILFPKLILRAPEPGELGPTSSGEVPDLIRIPLSLDLSLHAVPGLALILDFYLFEVKYAKMTARIGGAAIAALAAIWYGSWVEYCASYNKIFPYPFLTTNEFPVRVQIYAGATAFAYVVFQGLNAFHA